MKQINIFLGGYLNATNAQNLNCRSIAQHIDKEKFKVSGLEIYSGDLKSLSNSEVDTFMCKYPHRLSRYLGFFWGIIKCDIAYLPKNDCYLWNRFWLKLLRKKSFCTIETIIDDEVMEKLASPPERRDSFFKRYNIEENLYSITSYMKSYNFKRHSVKTKEKILFLGTDANIFLNERKCIRELKSIIFIGNDLIRKGIFDYLKLALINPDLTFHVVGTGNGQIDLKSKINELKATNIVYHGGLPHEQLVPLLKNIDLHILPSRSEGFPKVTLETAAAGVPSLVYSDYGAEEWIEHYKNGFVVNTFDEMSDIIRDLCNSLKLLKRTSLNATDLARQFDWKVLIKDWENEILSICAGKK